MHFTGTVYRNPYWPTFPTLKVGAHVAVCGEAGIGKREKYKIPCDIGTCVI